MASKRAKTAAAVAAVLVLAGVVAASVIRDQRSKVGVQIQKVARRDLLEGAAIYVRMVRALLG